jgi:hypothetical protein
MRSLWRKFRSLFRTRWQKLGGALLLYKSVWGVVWEWGKPMLDAVGRIDLLWQFRSALGLHWIVPILAAALSILNSPIGTALVILVGFALIIFGRAGDAALPATQHSADFTPSGGGVFTPAVTLGPAPQIFVSHIEVAFEALQSEGCILFNIGVVTRMNLELEKLAVGGIALKSTALTPDAKTLEIKTVRLDTPNVLQVAGQSVIAPPKLGPTFPVYRGVSTVILKQYLAPIVQTYVNMALATKKQILEFDLTGLKLTVLVPEVGNVRLPLWDGVTCRPGIAFSRVVALSASFGAPAPPKLNG